ncbi:sugar transporter SWEET1-like [Planococcus citri]|uniref:sugar transporter SWEET1-like n=1 Tax=Planococcus citri TaxID=170843 RepID=UPI0031F91762
MSLHEYKDFVGTLAGICTILQFFSPAFMCLDFIKAGSTENADVMPFIGGLVLSILFVQNAILIKDNIMLYVNAFALVLGVIYLVLYFFYTKNKVKFYLKLSKAAIFIAVIIGYAQRESKDVVQFRFGLIVTFILLALIASPLISVNEIIKTKNTSGLPIPLILSGTVVSFLWFLYGVIIGDLFVQVQNVTAFFLNAFQLGLLGYCKLSKPVKSASVKKSKKSD